MNVISCNVVILTRSHSITAEVELHGERLSDLLNNDRQSAISLLKTKVARLTQPTKVIAQQSSAVIPKHQILLAFEVKPQRTERRLYGYVKKNQHPIFAMMDGVEVQGIVHTTDSLDITDTYRFITMHNQMFVPVTQAQVTFCDDERYLIKQETVLVNVQRLHYIAKAPPPSQ